MEQPVSQNDPLTEDIQPLEGQVVAAQEPTHHEKTRAWVAYIIIGVGLALYASVIAAYLLPGGDRVEGLAQTVMGGAQALLGAVAGFYFASQFKE